MERTKQLQDEDYEGKIKITDDHNLKEKLFIEIKFNRIQKGYHNPKVEFRAGFNQVNTESIGASDGHDEYRFESCEGNSELKLFQSNTSTELKTKGWTVTGRAELHPELGEKILEILDEVLTEIGDSKVYKRGEE